MTATSGAGQGALRIIFAGTPMFAGEHLGALLAGSHCVTAVYTQPDRRAGRGKRLVPSPVKALALEHGLPVYQPSSLRDRGAQGELAALRADLMIVVAYGLLLPQAVLAIPRLGCINVHASLLPRWRGAAPVERAIEAGDTQTGITIMQMDAGLDTGAMLHRVSCPIDPDSTGDLLHARLSELGVDALDRTLSLIAGGQLQPVAQDDAQSSYANKLSKEEAWLDWTQQASTLARKVRAFRSSNVTCSELEGERVKIWMAKHDDVSIDRPPGTIVASDPRMIRVACGEGTLGITELQLPGRKALPVAAVLNARGQLFSSGARFKRAEARHHAD